jgi:hypothetical protein
MAGLGNGRCLAVCDVDEQNLKNGIAAAGVNPQSIRDYRRWRARISMPS